MGYLAGDKILDNEYNTFVASSSDPFGYNHFAGTGSAQYGLGETELAQVSADASNTIKAASWNSLFSAMDNIANHTNDSLTARGQVTVGDPIKIKAAVAADLATLAASVAGGSTSATALGTNAICSSTSGSTYNTSATIE